MCAMLNEIRANVNGPDYCAYLHSSNCKQRDNVRLCWYTNRKVENFEREEERDERERKVRINEIQRTHLKINDKEYLLR